MCLVATVVCQVRPGCRRASLAAWASACSSAVPSGMGGSSGPAVIQVWMIRSPGLDAQADAVAFGVGVGRGAVGGVGVLLGPGRFQGWGELVEWVQVASRRERRTMACGCVMRVWRGVVRGRALRLMRWLSPWRPSAWSMSRKARREATMAFAVSM